MDSSSRLKESGIEEVIYDNQRTLKEKAAGKRLEAVISDQLAAQVCIARVGDEVTNVLIKQCSRAVTECGEVCFLYEIAERVFVLRYNLRYTSNVGINNLEIEGDAHIRRVKNTPKESRQSAAMAVMQQLRLCYQLDADRKDHVLFHEIVPTALLSYEGQLAVVLLSLLFSS